MKAWALKICKKKEEAVVVVVGKWMWSAHVNGFFLFFSAWHPGSACGLGTAKGGGYSTLHVGFFLAKLYRLKSALLLPR